MNNEDRDGKDQKINNEKGISDSAECRICLNSGDLFSPCDCSGTQKYVHMNCLDEWKKTSLKSSLRCQTCGFIYPTKKSETPMPTESRFTVCVTILAIGCLILMTIGLPVWIKTKLNQELESDVISHIQVVTVYSPYSTCGCAICPNF